jgi:hypothetical protein
MSESKEKLIKVLAVRNIWVKGPKKAVKVPKGTVVELSKEDIANFGKAVTKDIPEDAE